MSYNHRILACLLPLVLCSTAMASTETADNSEQLEAVLALEGDADFGAYLSGECSTCHTADGNDPSIPLIHGKDKTHLVIALLEYRNEQRKSDVMRAVTADLSDEELAAIVTYLSAQ